MQEKVERIALDLGIDPEDLQKAIDKTKIIPKTKYLSIGKCKPVMISGFKHLLPLYKEAIDKINSDENLRVLNQLAAREGVDDVDGFITRMNTDSEYRTLVLRKYKIE